MSNFVRILLLIFALNSFAFADEIELVQIQEQPETPKALMNDEDYKLKGRVEYDDKGAMFLDDSDIQKLELNINVPKVFLSKSVLNDGVTLSDIYVTRTYNQNITNEYSISPVFGATEYKLGNYTYGTTYGTDIDIGQVEYRTKFYARYDHKHFALNAAYGKDGYTTTSRQLSSIYVAPELKLGRGFVLKDQIKYNPEIDRRRNEVVLQFSPMIKKSRDNVRLEAGVGQTQYQDGSNAYTLRFSTNFRL